MAQLGQAQHADDDLREDPEDNRNNRTACQVEDVGGVREDASSNGAVEY
jgi:hypothetical protein